MNEKTYAFLNSLTPREKDEIYRMLWKEYVLEDIKIYNRNFETGIDKETAEYAAGLYVYDCEYDCNLPYWQNIENVIDRAMQNSKCLDSNQNQKNSDKEL